NQQDPAYDTTTETITSSLFFFAHFFIIKNLGVLPISEKHFFTIYHQAAAMFTWFKLLTFLDVSSTCWFSSCRWLPAIC
ncbi:hypothetical protein ACJX0J_038658, partial [Zea mays]